MHQALSHARRDLNSAGSGRRAGPALVIPAQLSHSLDLGNKTLVGDRFPLEGLLLRWFYMCFQGCHHVSWGSCCHVFQNMASFESLSQEAHETFAKEAQEDETTLQVKCGASEHLKKVSSWWDVEMREIFVPGDLHGFCLSVSRLWSKKTTWPPLAGLHLLSWCQPQTVLSSCCFKLFLSCFYFLSLPVCQLWWRHQKNIQFDSSAELPIFRGLRQLQGGESSERRWSRKPKEKYAALLEMHVAFGRQRVFSWVRTHLTLKMFEEFVFAQVLAHKRRTLNHNARRLSDTGYIFGLRLWA